METRLQLRGTQFVRLPFLLIMLMSFNACSTSNEEIKNNSTEKMKGEKTFSFYEDNPAVAGGKAIYWEVNFNADSISSVYKNGEKISTDEIEKNKEMIFGKLDELRANDHELSFSHKHHPLDLKLKEQLKGLKDKSNWKFNDSLLHMNMEKLHEGLAKIKIPKFKMKKFQIQMDSLNDCLKNFDFEFDRDFDFDMKEFDANMEEFADRMSGFNFNFDLPNFEYYDFDLPSRDMDDEMENLDMEMNKLENFVKDLKAELVNDKILKNKNEKFELEFETEKIVVNGKELPDELFQKYKRMYKEYFGKELDGEFHIIE